MTLAELIPGLKGSGSRRAVDEVERLKQEAREHFAWRMAADDYFQRLRDDRADVYACWRKAEKGRQTAEEIVVDQESQIRDLKRQLAEAKRRLDVGVLAEAAAAKMQEIDVSGLRDNYSDGVRTLMQAHCIGPVLDPGHHITSQEVT